MKPPFWLGQEPSPCGHYFPEVIRLRDAQKSDGCSRVFDCLHCGEYQELIPPEEYSEKSIDSSIAPAVREVFYLALPSAPVQTQHV